LVGFPSSSSSFSSFFFLFTDDLFAVLVGVGLFTSFEPGNEDVGVGACDGVVVAEFGVD
jgi:hypothetical protein